MRAILLMSSVVLLALFPACSSDSDSCTTTADCFSGQVCLDDKCEKAVSLNNANNQNNLNNGTGNNQNSCNVDPFQNPCEDDAFEENDDYINAEALFGDSGVWCDGEIPVEHKRSEDLTFCANDIADAWRAPMTMWSPGCIDGRPQATVVITVSILTACDPSQISILPSRSIANPTRIDFCSDERPEVRCSVSEDGLVHTFEFLEDFSSENQIWDPRVIITAEENVQFDYRLEVEII